MALVKEKIVEAIRSASPSSVQAQATAVHKLWNDLINEGKTNSDLKSTCIQLLDGVVNTESVPLVVSKIIVDDLITSIFVHQTLDNQETALEIGHHLLMLIQPRFLSYEEQAAKMREILAKIYENRQQWRQAATVLAELYDNSQKAHNNATKLQNYIKIVQFYLADGDHVDAENYINRASMLQNAVDDRDLVLQYRVQYARVLECRGKYVEAAKNYYSLSLTPNLSETEKENVRRKALVCAVLAPAGQQRARMLATLFKDEKCRNLRQFSILQKMYLQRFIRPDELKDFAVDLYEHDKINKDGGSVLEKAMIEHNIVAIAALYTNISFEQLAQMLNISSEAAERAVSGMISENRLAGHIDQIKKLVHFSNPNAMADWDASIEQICDLTNTIADAITSNYPLWAEKNALNKKQSIS